MPDVERADGRDMPLRMDLGRFSLGVKAWETDFFNRLFGSLTWGAADLSGSDGDEIHRLCVRADAEGYQLTECHVDSEDFGMITTLEEEGFRLVDTRARFLTRWTRDLIPATKPTEGRVISAVPEHRQRMLELTHQGFTDNDRFVSRFKNLNYFTRDEARRYFEAWIDNSAFGDDSASAVYEVNGQTVGYYVYEAKGTHQGLPIVKGILTAVAPEHRGANAQLAMQAHLYRALGYSEWYLDNTTQITNKPVIRNHNRSAKYLSDIAFTFYRRLGS